MKKFRVKQQFLDHLRKVPIIQVACEKSGISRASIYRWRGDPHFAKEMDEAIAEGEEYVSDLSESQLMSLIKDKSYSAISFWLRHRSPKYREKIEVTANIKSQDELTPEQEEVVRRALQLATLVPSEEIININNEYEQSNQNSAGKSDQQDNTSRHGGSHDQGQGSQNGSNTAKP